MFTGIFFYLFMTAIIFWGYSGYVLSLILLEILQNKKTLGQINYNDRPKMALLVPCHNEEDFVFMKVENTRKLRYEQNRLTVYFLNGLSTDETGAKLREAVAKFPNWHVLETNKIGKINQINYGLSLLEKDIEIVVNTDMDTVLEEDVLEIIASEFQKNPNVAVVGANISPVSNLYVECNHWNSQNTFRILESLSYTSSIVVAPCYAFRRKLLDAFPSDCIADDIYIAFKANSDGYRSVYHLAARGSEIRTPNSIDEYITHKYRKGNAFMREILRFLYRLPDANAWWKVIFLTKLIQVIIIPWLLPIYFLSTISLLFSGGGLLKLGVMVLFFQIVGLYVASTSLKWFEKKYLGCFHHGILKSISSFFLANIIMVLVGISYPFYKQDSSYSKLKCKENTRED